jgi:hypothetical protein
MTIPPTPSGASERAMTPTGDYVIRRYSRSSQSVMAARLSGPWEVDRLRDREEVHGQLDRPWARGRGIA